MTSLSTSANPTSTSFPIDRLFLARFLALSMVSSVTIGMGKLVTTLFAVQIGATPMQVGLISATESLGMLLVTLPAGFVIARFGARRVYFAATMGPMLVSLLLPFTSVWYLLAAGRGVAGFCYPFRIVSMNSSFWEFLQRIGTHRAGWFRASGSVGHQLVGPLFGGLMIATTSVTAAYFLIAMMFALIAVYSQTLLPERHEVISEPVHASISQQLREILADPRIGECCLVELLDSVTIALVTTFIVVLAIQVLGVPQSSAVHLVMAQGAMSIVMLLLFGRLATRMERGKAYAVSLLAGVLGLGLIGAGTGFAPVVLGAVLLSGAQALVHLVNVNALSQHPVAKAKISGIYSLAQMGGAFTGSLLGGTLSHWVGLQHVFLLWIPLLLLGGGLIYWRRTNVTASKELADDLV